MTAVRPPLITPGLAPFDPAFESWWVRPGGATRVRVRPDDRLTVIDPDGGQPAEVVVLGADPEALGVRPDAPAAMLAGRGLVPEDARAIGLFGAGGPPGARQSFVARSDASVVVAAPGGRVVDGDWPASALVVELRARSRSPREEAELPEPLAEPRLDFRVDKATALLLRGPARASTSRSSTSPAASARTSSPSTRTGSTPASSAASTRRSRAR